VVAGRSLLASDSAAEPDGIPAVVTLSFAEVLWPTRSVIGQHFALAQAKARYRVVGIVEDYAVLSLRAPHRRAFLVPAQLADLVDSRFYVALRSQAPGALAEPARRTTATDFPNALVIRTATGRDLALSDLGSQRLAASFFSLLGAITVTLAAGGVFGLVAYLTALRQREMGLRLALGARPGQILWSLVASGVTPVAAGAVAGLIGSLVLQRYVQSELLGATGVSLGSYGGAAAGVLIPATLAALAAARGVRSLMPGVTLRVS
jgi:hypothetical protein